MTSCPPCPLAQAKSSDRLRKGPCLGGVPDDVFAPVKSALAGSDGAWWMLGGLLLLSAVPAGRLGAVDWLHAGFTFRAHPIEGLQTCTHRTERLAALFHAPYRNRVFSCRSLRGTSIHNFSRITSILSSVLRLAAVEPGAPHPIEDHFGSPKRQTLSLNSANVC